MFNIIITDIIVISDVNDIGNSMLLGVYGSLNVFSHTVFVQTVVSELYYSQLYPAYPSIYLVFRVTNIHLHHFVPTNAPVSVDIVEVERPENLKKKCHLRRM